MSLLQKVWPGRVLDARLQILDRQVRDAHGAPVGTVDDISLGGLPIGRDIPRGTPPPSVRALVFGHVVATRIFGGHPPESRLFFVDFSDVETLSSVVTLRIDADAVDTTWVERWLSREVIGRIPGGRHAPE